VDSLQKNLGKTIRSKNNAVFKRESVGKMLSSNLEANMETLKKHFRIALMLCLGSLPLTTEQKHYRWDGYNSDEIHENALRALLFPYRENAIFKISITLYALSHMISRFFSNISSE
jgi:hypothetical protein